MKTNCTCSDKEQDWQFDFELGCWYAIRSCNTCEYYWEGPDHSKTNYSISPAPGIAIPTNVVKSGSSMRDKNGEFSIYCYDNEGSYGLPIKFDEVKDIFDFCELNRYSHHMIKVITSSDDVVVSVLDGLYEFPSEWNKP